MGFFKIRLVSKNERSSCYWLWNCFLSRKWHRCSYGISENSESGIAINEVNKELGLRSYISGSITDLDLKEKIDRKLYRFMGDAAAYAYLSAEEAIKNANISNEVLKDYRTGIIMGSGGASSEDQID